MSLPEYWQRGPVPNIPPLLQPVAHALLQARDEVASMMDGFPGELLTRQVAALASPSFHLLHLSGVIDRLFTYARHESLNEQQFSYLRAEAEALPRDVTVTSLVAHFSETVARALNQLSETDEQSLTSYRPVGRAALPSTVIGLLFHAAEHTMRHTGQLLVTVTILKEFREE
jgi:uncharacterized damage-inducible protein DinB